MKQLLANRQAHALGVLVLCAIVLSACRSPIILRTTEPFDEPAPIAAPVTPVKCLAKQIGCNWNAVASPVTRTAARPGSGSAFLREAAPGEPWFLGQHVFGAADLDDTAPSKLTRTNNDPSPPSAPGNLKAQVTGLYNVSASWTESSDPESGIQQYAYAVGTGTTSATEANIRWWQVTGPRTNVGANLILTEGINIYVSVYALNGANVASAKVRAGPLKVAATQYGKPGNVFTYTIAPTGMDAEGKVIASWAGDDLVRLRRFLDRIIPVLNDLYGPPATNSNVKIVRDLRHRDNAVYSPDYDEIRGGDTMTLQLLTHELVHAWRGDRLLSSGPTWQFSLDLASFEEAFAHSAAYDAMTEFARRHPDFGLTQQLYQSSTEWDYDFQNVPELRTMDFWSNFGGTQLHWIRYEMGAAAIQKIQTEYPGLYRKFNAEYYARINANPRLTMSRELILEIFEKVAPVVEGMPVRKWIEEQHILAARIEPGTKVWMFQQRYPQRTGEYFLFGRVNAYQTFPNGSDWAWYPDGVNVQYHNLNGAQGVSRISGPGGTITVTHTLSPTKNPPEFMGFGSSDLNLTTQPTNQPWPGGDTARYALNMLQLGLYRIDTEFTAGSKRMQSVNYEVMGQELRDARGAWGGIIGATGGVVTLTHSASPLAVTAPVTNGAFYVNAPWLSQVNSPTNSIDSIPGVIEIRYRDPAGRIYSAQRSIIYGSWYGNQAFLFQLGNGTLDRPKLGRPGETQTRKQFMPAVVR